MLACGRTIIEDTVPSFTPPAFTSIDILPNNRVKINWYFDAYQEPLVKGFRIERSENNGSFQLLSDDITPNQRSIELAEPFRGGKVSFRLLSKTIKDTVASTVVSYFAPTVPTNAFCSAVSATLLQGVDKPNVYLSWQLEGNSANYAGNYIIQRSVSKAAFQTIGTTRNPFFLDTNTEVGVNYSYVVRLATNNCASNEVPITVTTQSVGLCPQNFKLSFLAGKDKKSVLLNWDAQLADFAKFYVFRKASESGVFENLTPTGIRTTVFEDKTELKAKTSYFYKITSQIESQPPTTCESPMLEIKNY
ncbi:hypothetical protein GCM10011514_47510 [Emticicia aquatilis]|uniref:Fibronectin type III domain-containing protein n=2 Tax=Emticicia aquatilis TaxID=1537369 RepID=A0A917DXF6_9BACT|nr:hypothetical protein GCM10011514_47510 [Emticicia aquatilis]